MVQKGAVKEFSEEEVLIDTPVRGTQITAPPTKFEESPVFNFLNSLSPIKMVSSVHISQTINSLTFTSIPSIFASPHLATLKDSTFLRRHQLGDPSKPEFSSDDISKLDNTNGKADAMLDSENKENITSGGPIEESKEPPYECSRSPNHNSQSPNINQITPCGHRTKLQSETEGSFGSFVQYVQEECDSMFYETEMAMEVSSQIDEYKEGSECEWDNLISDTADLLNFDSPNDTEALNKMKDPQTRFYPLMSNDMESSRILVGPSGQHGEGNDSVDQFIQPGDGREVNVSTEDPNMNGLSSKSTSAVEGSSDNLLVRETVSHFYRGMRRRCLDFDLSGARKKLSPDTSKTDSPILQSDGNCKTIDKQTSHAKFRNESSRRVLPVIGLHLNSLGETSKDYKVVKNESCTSGKQLVIAPGSASHSHLLNNRQNSLGEAVDVTQSDGQIVFLQNRGSVQQDGGHGSDYKVNEEYSQTSPKRKRRRSESGEGEACKRCNCKKSKCLKLYCECFAAGLYCVEPCSCIDCFNKPSHEDTVLATRKHIESRNPLAFAPKVIRNSDHLSEAGDDSSKTPASARHKRGCNCKKSGCLKKYCECYQGGIGCSINCRCERCKNAFGRKDGSEILEEIDATQKSFIDRSQQRSLNTEQSLDYVNPATPVPSGRNMYDLSFPSKNKPPRSTFLFVGSSSAVYSSQGFARPDFYQPPSKFEDNLGLLHEEDIPMLLQTSGSPISRTKSSSPNGKRVSPPHSVHETLPSQRSSRKLILQSIPSFPTLAPKNDGGVSLSEPESAPFPELH